MILTMTMTLTFSLFMIYRLLVCVMIYESMNVYF
jgi:hypothetical protein